MSETRNNRADIQVLRALAVMMVVIFHLFPAQLSGGFAGVDVFFVISGYLISSTLLRELNQTGRIGLVKFWAKRMRRLLPAAFAVITISALASAIFVPAFTRAEFVTEGIASIFYFENWSLAFSSADYFGDSNASPYQHFWSLAVEEQFYLVWPLALMTVIWLSKRRSRSALSAFIGAAAFASFATAAYFTQIDPGAAYFNSFLRVWQFAVGASIAHLLAKKSFSMRISPWMSLIGFALILATALLAEPSSGFPGSFALLPVFGTALVIIGGLQGLPRWLERSYALKPLQFLGDVSYSIYLWHWPLIVLAPFVFNRATTTFEKFILLLLSIVLAWATKKYIEDPARTAKLFTQAKPRLTIVAALATSVLLAGGLASVSAGAPIASGSNIISLDQAKHDAADEGSKCMTKAEDGEVIWCQFGDQAASYRVLLIGDSHAATHLAGFKLLADKNDWSLALAYKAGCSFSLVERNQTARGTSCAEWNSNLQTKFAAEAPFDLVVTANFANNFLADIEAPNWQELAVTGYRAAWQPLIESGAQVVALRDNPQMTQNMKNCWDEAISDASQCNGQKTEMLHPDASQPAAQNFEGAYQLDLTDLYCDGETCSAQRDGVYIYRNADHISATYSRVISGELYQRLQNLLGGF